MAQGEMASMLSEVPGSWPKPESRPHEVVLDQPDWAQNSSVCTCSMGSYLQFRRGAEVDYVMALGSGQE